jgi:hypothetical protein
MEMHLSTVVYSAVAIAVSAYWIWFLAERYLIH